MSVGKRIYLKRQLPDPALVKEFETVPASNTGDVMGRSCGMDPRIRLMSQPSKQMTAGPALTVKTCAGQSYPACRAQHRAGRRFHRCRK